MADRGARVRWPVRLLVAALFYGAMFALAATVPAHKADAVEATALLIALNIAFVLAQMAIKNRQRR